MPSSIFAVKTFGALGDGITYDDLAFQHALEAINALSPASESRGAILHIPFGTYRLRQTLHITRQMIIQGVSGAGDHPGSLLRFDVDVDGIVVHHLNEGLGGDGSWTVIRDIGIVGSGNFAFSNCPNPPINEDDPLTATPDHTNHPILAGSGIVLNGHGGCIENCLIAGFHYDGVHIETINDTKNANNWEIHNCRILENGRHGVFTAGENSNAGRVFGIDCSANCGWGIYDRSFLGNTYIGCHVAENGHSATDIQAVVVDPLTPTTLYLGTYDGGVFQSTDSGVNWTAINLGLPVLSVQALALAIDPATSTTLVYAGTPEYVDVFTGGVFQFKIQPSTGRMVWFATGLTNLDVHALAINPWNHPLNLVNSRCALWATVNGKEN